MEECKQRLGAMAERLITTDWFHVSAAKSDWQLSYSKNCHAA